MPTDEESPLMTTAEVARYIRKTPHAVRQMRHRGVGPQGTRVGKNLLFHRDVVAAWWAARIAGDPLAQRAA